MTNNYSKRYQTYTAYNLWLLEQLNEAQDNFIMGREVSETLPLWNMFFLLMQLRNEDYASAQPTAEEVNCMSDRLFCFGIDTSKMEEIWPPSYDDGDKDVPVDGYDGIDFMQLEGDGTQHPKFRIR